jgi:HAD superfamily hydrolase (TIGR01509 family)
MVTTLIFDCDGVLADTERFGHLPAFNETFRHFGLPVQWSEEEYGRRLRIGGGKERMASLLTPDFVAQAGLPTDPDAQQAEIARWHEWKTRRFAEMVAAGDIAPRPGVGRIIQAALDAGWTLAVASTSAETSVRAILDHVAGADAARFGGVFAGDVVAHKKPAPDIYLLALERLGADRDATLVIEDSANGAAAAAAAGLACAITVNGYTRDEAFPEAPLVVDSLGDPGAPAIEVLADRAGVRPEAYVTLDDLAACIPG